MNYDGPWSWRSTKQKRRELTQAERDLSARVTKNKRRASSRARSQRKAVERRGIWERNHAPIGMRHVTEKYWDALRRRQRIHDESRGYADTKLRRTTALQRATPDWANPKAMLRFYIMARRLSRTQTQDYHVDHIVPVQSKWVCGLNCEANMRVLPASENMSKGNRHWPDMPDVLEPLANKVLSV